jgi:hypothetical protein
VSVGFAGTRADRSAKGHGHNDGTQEVGAVPTDTPQIFEVHRSIRD